MDCDVLIVGGGTGGVAAALAACERGAHVRLTEPLPWVGGQLTSQIVPPDEHPWIESFGCTRRYRTFRNGVRQWFRVNGNLTPAAARDAQLNPGRAWVTNLAFPPRVGLAVLLEMLRPHLDSGRLDLHLGWDPVAAELDADGGDVAFRDRDGTTRILRGRRVLDATETGELLALAGVPFRIGSESRAETGEPSAGEESRPENLQAITWCFAMGFDPHGSHVIDRPAHYAKWREFRPPFWPGPLLGWEDVHPWTLQPRTLQLFPGPPGTPVSLFNYRRIVCAENHVSGVPHDATVVNWPMNDYFEGHVVGATPEQVAQRLGEAKELSRCLLYWLQTEAPRPDGGTGYPGLYLRPDLTGTEDGFAMAPYHREGRRLRARVTVTENDLSPATRPGANLAREYRDSVGVGYYRIDLHPSTGGDNYLDVPSLPFQIPLGALLPEGGENLIAAAKNIGTTHITNGCYRLHPVEWTVGEAAGALAAFSLQRGVSAADVWESSALLDAFQAELGEDGFELEWSKDLSLPKTAGPGE